MVSDGVGRVLNDDGLTPTRQPVVARDVLGFDQHRYQEGPEDQTRNMASWTRPTLKCGAHTGENANRSN